MTNNKTYHFTIILGEEFAPSVSQYMFPEGAITDPEEQLQKLRIASELLHGEKAHRCEWALIE